MGDQNIPAHDMYHRQVKGSGRNCSHHLSIEDIMTFISAGKLFACSLIVCAAFSSTAFAQDKSATSSPTELEDVQKKAISDGSAHNKKDVSSIQKAAPIALAAPSVGCVTVDGAADANCDGVDDASLATKRKKKKRKKVRRERMKF